MAPSPLDTFPGADERPTRDGHAGRSEPVRAGKPLREPGEEPAGMTAFLRVVLDQLPVAVLITTAPDRAPRFANAAFERLLGQTAAWAEHGPAYHRWTPLRGGRACPRDERPMYRALAGETVVGEMLAFPCTDGSTAVFRVHAGPVRDAQGAIVAAAVAFEDATGEHRAHEAMATLNAALEARVEERTAEVRALTAALTLAEQRERARIAQVLHDDLQQVLYGSRLQLQGVLGDLARLSDRQAGEAEHTAAREALTRAHGLLDTAIRLTRTLSLDLSPPVSASEGLGASLAWLSRHLRGVHGLRVEVRDEGAPPLPADVHDLLFQLTRELLFNVAKHAAVQEARVLLRAAPADATFTLEVEDHGRGFEASALAAGAPGGGFGLHSVRERLGLLGGRMTVRSSPEAGTRVTLSLPLALLTPAVPAAEPPTAP